MKAKRRFTIATVLVALAAVTTLGIVRGTRKVQAQGEAQPIDDSKSIVESGGQITGPACVTVKSMGWPTVTKPNPTTGHELTPLRIVSIVPSNIAADLRQQLFAFGDAVAQGSWLPKVGASYGITSAGVHEKIVGAAITGTSPCGGMPWNKTQATSYIENEITSHSNIAHDGHTVYVLYLPSACKVIFTDNQTPSFHSSFPSNPLGDGWAAVQPTIAPGATLAQRTDTYTVPASHEIIEAATDTGKVWALVADSSLKLNQQNPWVAENGRLHVEVGDLCGGTRIRVPEAAGNFLYTRVFANSATSDPCVPSLGDTYVNTTPEIRPTQLLQPGWVTIAPTGTSTKTVKFTIRGWIVGGAQGCAPIWNISATAVKPGSGPGINGISPAPGGVSLSQATLGNGGSATLSIVVPAGATSGKWLAVKVISTPPSTNPDHDTRHEQLYGVYIN
jgi:hypothetical protein